MKLKPQYRKAAATKHKKWETVGAIAPIVLASGEVILNVIVIKAPEGKDVKFNVPIEPPKVPLPYRSVN